MCFDQLVQKVSLGVAARTDSDPEMELHIVAMVTGTEFTAMYIFIAFTVS